MKSKLCIISVFIIVLAEKLKGDNNAEKEFDNDLQLKEEETGGTLRLRSRGNLSDIVDLDRTDGVKVKLKIKQKGIFEFV